MRGRVVVYDHASLSIDGSVCTRVPRKEPSESNRLLHRLASIGTRADHEAVERSLQALGTADEALGQLLRLARLREFGEADRVAEIVREAASLRVAGHLLEHLHRSMEVVSDGCGAQD